MHGYNSGVLKQFTHGSKMLFDSEEAKPSDIKFDIYLGIKLIVDRWLMERARGYQTRRLRSYRTIFRPAFRCYAVHTELS